MDDYIKEQFIIIRSYVMASYLHLHEEDYIKSSYNHGKIMQLIDTILQDNIDDDDDENPYEN